MSSMQVAALLAGFWLLLGAAAGFYLRKRIALRDTHRLMNYYESLLRADLVRQHTYLDKPALVYVALCGDLAYVGQTTQELKRRIYQHERGNTSFDRIYGRNPGQWQWFVLEHIPCTYRYAAERAWIERYKSLNYKLLNGNDGTEDGLEWEIAA